MVHMLDSVWIHLLQPSFSQHLVLMGSIPATNELIWLYPKLSSWTDMTPVALQCTPLCICLSHKPALINEVPRTSLIIIEEACRQHSAAVQADTYARALHCRHAKLQFD